jgi:hypothetical protein
VGEALARREALALAHELHAVGVAGVHKRLQDRRVLRREQGVELESATDVRLDGDEMTADADDAGHVW